MAAIAYDVAAAFTRRQAARSGAFVSVEDAIYSYGMKLAHWDGSAIRFDYQRRDEGGKAQSVTTARHMAALEATCREGTEG